MDTLSEVLSTIRLDGAVYIDAEFSAPWCVEAGYGLPCEASQLAGADHIIFFHCLIEGACRVRLSDGSETLTLASGDLVVFPHDHRHVLGTDLGLRAVASDDIAPETPASELIRLRHGGGGAVTRFVCGYLACNRRATASLLAALPQMLKVSLGGDPAAGWLLDLLRLGVQQSQVEEAGVRSIRVKLAELLMVEALRRHAASLPDSATGWLAGLRDPLVGRVLSLMHRRPADPWTVDSLARAVASSRSVLAERFATITGEPPIQYLARYRLALAAQALRVGDAPIGTIFEAAGYGSEAAFTRAFKREYGMPPAAWRRHTRKETPAFALAPG